MTRDAHMKRDRTVGRFKRIGSNPTPGYRGNLAIVSEFIVLFYDVRFVYMFIETIIHLSPACLSQFAFPVLPVTVFSNRMCITRITRRTNAKCAKHTNLTNFVQQGQQHQWLWSSQGVGPYLRMKAFVLNCYAVTISEPANIQ